MTQPNLNKGLIASLFDLSFKNIITTKIIRILYVLALVLLGLFTLLFLIFAFHMSVAFGVVTLFILAPLYFLVSLIYVRVLLEFVMTVFAIQENTGRMVQAFSEGYVAAASPAMPQPQPSYEIGALVNGYRFDGTQWLPVDPF